MLEEDKVEPVVYDEPAADEARKLDEYNRMLDGTGILQREPDQRRPVPWRYRPGQLPDGPVGAEEYILLYRNRERGGWSSLGRADSREILNTMANILRRFLCELNRACETVYVMEPVLADTGRHSI